MIDFSVFFFNSLADSIRILLTITDYFKELASSKARRKARKKTRKKILTISKTLTFEDRRGRRICYKMARRMRSINTRVSNGINSDKVVGADILIN